MNKPERYIVGMDYSHYSVKDFVRDEFFQQWVMSPDVATNSFWEQWIKTHPEKITCIKEAKGILENLILPYYRLTDNDIEELWHRIKNSSGVELS